MITVMWKNEEKTIVIWRFGESWTREEFYDAQALSKRLTQSVDHIVHVIVDLLLVGNTPSSVITLARAGMRARSSNSGCVVVVARSHLWARLYQYMQSVYPMDLIPVTFMKSDTEAMETLQQSMSPDGCNSIQLNVNSTRFTSLVR